MRTAVLIAMLMTLSGCGNYRDVTFVYYPKAPPNDKFPPQSQFYAVADKECRRYGMTATPTPTWTTVADFQRVKVYYGCVQ